MAEPITLKLPSLLVNKGSRYSTYYVYTYQNVWNDKKGRSERKNSKKVGMVVGGAKDGLIKWDQSFIEQYPELEHVDTFRENGKYVFKAKADTDSRSTAFDFERPSKIYHAGATYALDSVVAQSPLAKALANAFAQHNDFRKILSVAYFLILNKDSNILHYEDFVKSTKLPYQQALSCSAIHRLGSRIEMHDVDHFVQFMTDYFIKHYSKEDENVLLVYDSSNIAACHNHQSLSDFDKNVEFYTKDEPEINVLLLADQKTGIPLFYSAYNGAVPDITALRSTISDATRHTFCKNLVFVMDKSNASESAINDCLCNDVSFVANMQVDASDSFIQDAINSNYKDLISKASYNRQIRQNVLTIKIKWKHEPNCIQSTNLQHSDQKELFLHLFYDQKIHYQASDVITQNAALICEILNNGDEIRHEALKSVKDSFVVFDDKRQKWVISDLKVDEHIRYKAIRAILSDCQEDAIKCYEACYDRNEIEHSFNTLNYRFKCQSQYSNESFYGIIFIQFIATSIAIMLRKRLNEFKHNIKSSNTKNKVLYSSDNKILSSLNNLMLLATSQGSFYDDITDRMADFFRALNIDIPCGKYDGCNPISEIADESEIDIDRQESLDDEIFA